MHERTPLFGRSGCLGRRAIARSGPSALLGLVDARALAAMFPEAMERRLAATHLAQRHADEVLDLVDVSALVAMFVEAMAACRPPDAAGRGHSLAPADRRRVDQSSSSSRGGG
jgi:hypothetical protein